MSWQDLGEPLGIDQIDFRVQSISKSGWATILAYKDARVDMDRLDAVVGRGKWQRKHDIIDGQLYCSVGLYNEAINQWVWVQDVGTESNTEKEKGRASDSFKRACFNLGIGRELYDFPLILVELKENEFTVDGNKGKQTYNLRLRQWKWSMDRDPTGIASLKAVDDNGAVRYNFGQRVKAPAAKAEPEQKPEPKPELPAPTPEQIQQFNECADTDDLQALWMALSNYDRHVCAKLKDNAKTRLQKAAA